MQKGRLRPAFTVAFLDGEYVAVIQRLLFVKRCLSGGACSYLLAGPLKKATLVETTCVLSANQAEMGARVTCAGLGMPSLWRGFCLRTC